MVGGWNGGGGGSLVEGGRERLAGVEGVRGRGHQQRDLARRREKRLLERGRKGSKLGMNPVEGGRERLEGERKRTPAKGPGEEKEEEEEASGKGGGGGEMGGL